MRAFRTLRVRNATRHRDVMAELRDAVGRDQAALQRLFRDASLANEGDRETLLATPGALTFDGALLSSNRVRIAEMDGVPVGFSHLTFGRRACELHGLFVDPTAWRRGIGRALLDDAIAAARPRRLYVLANRHSAGFYEARGFVTIATIVTPLGDAVRMVDRA